jgi:putative membrane protein
MLLPGISGSYILVLLGQYAFMITAVNNLNIITLLIFIAGAITGLLTFTKFIYFIINRWKENTTILMTGLIIGSLTKLWPWKDGLDKNTYPTNWENIYNNDPQILLSITLFISGITVAICISFLSIKLSKKLS